MHRFNRRFVISAGSFWILLAAAIAAPAQQGFKALVDFDGTDGANPHASLVQGLDGSLYGTTYNGGANNCGTVFKITPAGTLTTLHDFCSQQSDGDLPYAGLLQAANGNLYGTTVGGGASSFGTVFTITPAGATTVLHSFTDGDPDGAEPHAGLIQAASGTLYGTTYQGGHGAGTVFSITPEGALTLLYSFCSETNCTDGAAPAANLVQASDGNLYGTTYNGGANNNNGACSGTVIGCGTAFRITSSGQLTILYSFCAQTNCTDGANPAAAFVEASDGSLYGTTEFGGAYGYGTVFKMTLTGQVTTLYSFCTSGCADGGNPYGGLFLATDGNFYGTTQMGGANNFGTAFSITPAGALTVLHSFDYTDGSGPAAGLVQATNGAFYVARHITVITPVTISAVVGLPSPSPLA